MLWTPCGVWDESLIFLWFCSLPIKSRSLFLLRGVVKAEELILCELFRDTHVGTARITLGGNVSDALSLCRDLFWLYGVNIDKI